MKKKCSGVFSAQEDEQWMRAALAEARRGLGRTRPNPAVGAVLVREGRELARGWHRAAGQPHAEVEALQALPPGQTAQGATLYVTLEPCSTHGRTPPCTEAIVRAGIRRVVYGATDPNPRHAGRAQALLTAAGLEVTTGVLQTECEELNLRWNFFMRTGLPWVILKAGVTLDGRITRPVSPSGAISAAGPSPSPRITSAVARADAQQWRKWADAVLVGAGTLRADNPRLTVRRGEKNAPQPWRIIWSRHPENLPAQARVFQDRWRHRTLVCQQERFEEVLRELAQRQITCVLVEGGSAVHGAVVDSGLVNEVVVYLAPLLFGGGLPMVGGLGVGDWSEGLVLHRVQVAPVGRRGDLRFHALVQSKEKKGP